MWVCTVDGLKEYKYHEWVYLWASDGFPVWLTTEEGEKAYMTKFYVGFRENKASRKLLMTVTVLAIGPTHGEKSDPVPFGVELTTTLELQNNLIKLQNAACAPRLGVHVMSEMPNKVLACFRPEVAS